jgi:hypothetical protein
MHISLVIILGDYNGRSFIRTMSQRTFSSSNAVQDTELEAVEDVNVSSSGVEIYYYQHNKFSSTQQYVAQVVKMEGLVFIPTHASVSQDNTLDLFVKHV